MVLGAAILIGDLVRHFRRGEKAGNRMFDCLSRYKTLLGFDMDKTCVHG